MRSSEVVLLGEPGQWSGVMEWASATNHGVVAFTELTLALGALELDEFVSVVCVSPESIEMLGADGVSALKQSCYPAPVTVALTEPSNRVRTWMSWGVDTIVPIRTDAHPSEASEVHGLLVSVARRASMLDMTRVSLAQRDAELAGLDALAYTLSGAVGPAEIVHRCIVVLGGMMRRPCVAYIEIVDRESMEMRVVEQSAQDRLLVCMTPAPHASWRELVANTSPHVVRGFSPGAFPGIEPLGMRAREAGVALVPVWGRSQPLGVLVLCDLSPRLVDTSPLSNESLRAIASLLGTSLENSAFLGQLRDAYRSLQDTQDRLVHAERFSAVGEMAAQVAHEINNPLSFVVSNLGVMGEYIEDIEAFFADAASELDEAAAQRLVALRARHDIDGILDDVQNIVSRSQVGLQRIHRIVQDLRHFAYDAGHEPDDVDLPALIHSCVAMSVPEGYEAVEVELDLDGPARVHTDPNRLSQVLVNLIVNARHAIETEDGVSGTIRIVTGEDDDGVMISVIDDGPGIPVEQMQLVFKPFYTAKRRGEGTGMGLALSRDIVRRLGGEIRLTSTPGQGARFDVVLPESPPAQGAAG